MSKFILSKTSWGVDEFSNKLLWPELLRRMKTDGFDALEFCIGPFNPFANDRSTIKQMASDAGIRFVCQLHTCSYPVPSCTRAGVKEHLASLERLTEEAMLYDPLLINAHSGKDAFTTDEALTFFEAACKLESKITNDVPLVHETHRQRILHSPFVYRSLMNKLPSSLKLNADLSHWTVVCERCLGGEHDADFWDPVLSDVAERTHYIHARVGFSQGSQVPDPLVAEYREELDAHFVMWDKIVASMRRREVPVIVEPEYGPYPYYHGHTHSGKRAPALWQTCTDFGVALRKRYGQV